MRRREDSESSIDVATSCERSALRAPRRERPRPFGVVVAQVAIDVCTLLGPVPAPSGAEGACTMFNAVQVLPAGPGGLQAADVFPVRERLRFRDSFGLALLELRARSLPFQGLAKGPWALFIAISVHWQGNAEAWPSQETLARFSGWSSRAVRDQAAALERSGFVRVRRERRFDGSERIFYAPGLVTLAALADFFDRFPRERAKPLRAEAPPAIAHPAEAASAARPEEASRKHRDQDQIKPSSSCGPHVGTTSTPATEEQQVQISQEDEEVARRALAERMARKHPARPAPSWFDAGEVAMVAACAAALDGDAEAKMVAHRDAIAGAFIASKEGPPTARFIWKKLDHFFDHVERGRRRRLADERAAGRTATLVKAFLRPQPVAPVPMPDELRAELDRLLGAGWRGTYVPR
jgi:hypothetical protein